MFVTHGNDFFEPRSKTQIRKISKLDREEIAWICERHSLLQTIIKKKTAKPSHQKFFNLSMERRWSSCQNYRRSSNVFPSLVIEVKCLQLN